MQKFWPVLLVTAVLAGCDSNAPTSAVTSDDQIVATFSELSMIKTSVAGITDPVQEAAGFVPPHDSLRHAAMLDSLKARLSLTDAQFDSIKAFASVLWTTLRDTRIKVDSGLITREEAQVLVKAARDQFVASVKSVLTDAQKVLFDEWLQRHWINGHRQRGPKGPRHGAPVGPPPGGHRGPH